MDKKFDIEKIIYILIILVMILIPVLKLSTYIPEINRFYIRFFEIKRVYILWGAIFFLIFTYFYVIMSEKERINYIDILIYILIVLAFVSTNYAIDFDKAFFGEQYRYEGLLTVVSYYLLVLNAKSIKQEKYRKKIIKLFLAIGIFQATYGILQSYTDFSFIRRHSTSYMAMGLCSNPNFFGSYMVMQVLTVGYMYLYTSKKRYLLIYILFGIALYTAESTGPVLAAIMALIFSIFIMPKNIKKILVLIVLLLGTLGGTYYSLKTVQKQQFNTVVTGGSDIVSEVSTIPQKPIKEVGAGRFEVWENSLPLVKKYWLTGCGLDNFKNVYPNSGYISFDKAHNVYLQIAVTNGVPAIIVFLILLIVAFIKGIKIKNKFITPIYMAFIGYSIQAFANISVIDVAPYYYIILGLILSYDNNIKGKNKEKNLIK